MRICQDIPKSLELLQLCVTANNKRYVNAAIAWALHKSIEQFHTLIRSATLLREQKSSVLIDILNVYGQMGSKQFASAKLKLEFICEQLYSEIATDSSAVTFADVQQRYKHETSGIGVKRPSPTADEFFDRTQGDVDITL